MSETFPVRVIYEVRSPPNVIVESQRGYLSSDVRDNDALSYEKQGFATALFFDESSEYPYKLRIWRDRND